MRNSEQPSFQDVRQATGLITVVGTASAFAISESLERYGLLAMLTVAACAVGVMTGVFILRYPGDLGLVIRLVFLLLASVVSISVFFEWSDQSWQRRLLGTATLALVLWVAYKVAFLRYRDVFRRQSRSPRDNDR